MWTVLRAMQLGGDCLNAHLIGMPMESTAGTLVVFDKVGTVKGELCGQSPFRHPNRSPMLALTGRVSTFVLQKPFCDQYSMKYFYGGEYPFDSSLTFNDGEVSEAGGAKASSLNKKFCHKTLLHKLLKFRYKVGYVEPDSISKPVEVKSLNYYTRNLHPYFQEATARCTTNPGASFWGI